MKQGDAAGGPDLFQFAEFRRVAIAYGCAQLIGKATAASNHEEWPAIVHTSQSFIRSNRATIDEDCNDRR
jgi:hypothetical protein